MSTARDRIVAKLQANAGVIIAAAKANTTVNAQGHSAHVGDAEVERALQTDGYTDRRASVCVTPHAAAL